MTIKEIVSKSIAQRIEQLVALKKTAFPTSKQLQFLVSDFRDKEKIETQLNLLSRNKNVVYMIREKRNRMSPEQVLQAFKKWHKKNPDIHLSRVNDKNICSNKKFTLYVGSKEKQFRTRIQQHIGNNNRRTYALHLKDWLSDKTAIIEIEYFCFEQSIKRAQLQIIEDSLWDYFLPLFGKRGAH